MTVKRSLVTRARLKLAIIEHQLALAREQSTAVSPGCDTTAVLERQFNDALSERNRVADAYHSQVTA